ncbi:MAG TPA: YncE family protein [Acidimicrobiia bacterium]|nr:YncE family protein [Acidimicrobiia bacterium]
MSRAPLQLGLAALFLAIFTWVGLFALTDADPIVGQAVGSTPTTTTTTTLPTTSTSATASTASLASTTTTARARQVDVEVFPEGSTAELRLSGASGESITGSGSLTATLAGDAELVVEAEGYRTETIELTDDVAGNVDVWLDPPDQVVDRRMVFSTGSAPKQVAFTPDASELWVTLLGGSGLEAYDPLTGELIAAIDLPEAGSVEVIFDTRGEKAYVSQMETASVYEIDVATHSVDRQLLTEGSWTKVMVLSADGSRLWASNWVSNDVSEFDLETGEMVRRLPTVATPRGLAVDPESTRLYVAGYDAGDIEVIDLASGEASTIHHSGGALRHLAARPAAGLIYASDMALDTIFVIDTATDTVSTMGTTDRLPNTIDLSPDGRFLAVSNRGRNNPESYYLPGPEWGSILLLDTTDGTVLDAIVGGNQPTGLDISADGAWLAYSDFLDNRVTVLALPTTEELLAAGGGRADSYQAQLNKG